MALLSWSSSPSPRQQGAELDMYVHGQVVSSPIKSVNYLHKSKKNGVFSDKMGCDTVGGFASGRLLRTAPDCKYRYFDLETVVVCNHLCGEPLLSQGGCVMESLTLGGFVSPVNFLGFRNLYQKIANPKVFPIMFNVNPNILNPNPNLLNTNPNEFGANPNVCNANSHLSFTGGDDFGKSSAGSDGQGGGHDGAGSGGQGGGHDGRHFGDGDHFDSHSNGLAFLGMHALFQGIDEAKLFDHKAMFDSLNFLVSTLVSTPGLVVAHAKLSNEDKDGLSSFTNVFAPEIDALDQNSRVEVGKDNLSHGSEESTEMHAYGVNNDHGMHGPNMNGVSPGNVHAPSSFLSDGFDVKASEKNRGALDLCDASSSLTNCSNSDTVADTDHHCQRSKAVHTFFANLRRHVSHIQWKFVEENQQHSASAPVQADVLDGDQDDDIHIESCDLEGALDDMVLLAAGVIEMGSSSFQPRELKFNADVSSSKQAQSEKQSFLWKTVHQGISPSFTLATHLWQQGVIDWFGQLARPALANQAGIRECSSKAEQVEEHKSRVSSSEGVATIAPKMDSEAGGTPPGAKQSDIDALRRLQREVFSELMKLREKVEKLEQLAQARQKLDRFGAARTHLKGQVKAGTAFVLLEGSSSRHSRDSLEQAGMQTGLDVKFTFETPFREKDVLITQCLSGQGSSVGDSRALGGPLSLGKLQYVAHVNDDVSFSFVPLGAQGKDVTEIINVLQDQGLTAFSSQGPALFNHCKGSALGATVSGSRFAFSLAQYLSGWGNHVSAMGSLSEDDPLCLSTLGQILLQPTEGFILALSGLNRYWPSPPFPSSMALHWSEMGPLIIPKIQSLKANRSSMAPSSESRLHISRLGSHWEAPDLEHGANACESQGTGLLSLAIASSLDLGENLSVSGWAQIEKGESLQDSDKGNFQWALSLARTCGSGIDWGASIGGSRPDMWSMANSRHDDYDGDDLNCPQLHVEAFVKLRCGRGFTLQPGLLYVSSKHSHTPAFIVRSSWSL